MLDAPSEIRKPIKSCVLNVTYPLNMNGPYLEPHALAIALVQSAARVHSPPFGTRPMRSVRNYRTKESITRRGAAAKQNDNNIALGTLRLSGFRALPCDIRGLRGGRTGQLHINPAKSILIIEDTGEQSETNKLIVRYYGICQRGKYE